jgi:hypothetical protein
MHYRICIRNREEKGARKTKLLMSIDTRKWRRNRPVLTKDTEIKKSCNKKRGGQIGLPPFLSLSRYHNGIQVAR